MNKTELIEKVPIQTRTQASLAVDNVLASIQETLQNGESISTPVGKVPAFKAGKQLKELVNN